MCDLSEPDAIHRSAALVRARAHAASGGPWRTGTQLGRTLYANAVPGMGKSGRYFGSMDLAQDSAHVAAWHPEVALMAADLLDAQARCLADEIARASPGLGRAAWSEPSARAFALAQALLADARQPQDPSAAHGLDPGEVRVDVFTSGEIRTMRAIHLPTGVTATVDGSSAWLRDWLMDELAAKVAARYAPPAAG